LVGNLEPVLRKEKSMFIYSPNVIDPVETDMPAVTTCYRCGCPICVDDEYARIDGVDYCQECLEDMPLSELISLCGEEWMIAREADRDA
jgi:hypothetical protein